MLPEIAPPRIPTAFRTPRGAIHPIIRSQGLIIYHAILPHSQYDSAHPSAKLPPIINDVTNAGCGFTQALGGKWVQGLPTPKNAPGTVLDGPGRGCPPISIVTATPGLKSKRGTRYSINSSGIMVGGIVSPSCLAVFELMISWNFTGWTTGRSAGLAPLRMRPARMPA
jgi:hypothetical protein